MPALIPSVSTFPALGAATTVAVGGSVVAVGGMLVPVAREPRVPVPTAAIAVGGVVAVGAGGRVGSGTTIVRSTRATRRATRTEYVPMTAATTSAMPNAPRMPHVSTRLIAPSPLSLPGPEAIRRE